MPLSQPSHQLQAGGARQTDMLESTHAATTPQCGLLVEPQAGAGLRQSAAAPVLQPQMAYLLRCGPLLWVVAQAFQHEVANVLEGSKA